MFVSKFKHKMFVPDLNCKLFVPNLNCWTVYEHKQNLAQIRIWAQATDVHELFNAELNTEEMFVSETKLAQSRTRCTN